MEPHLVDAGPVTGEVEMAAVNGGVEIYTVIEDELLRWEMLDDGFKRSVVTENVDLSTSIGVDHDRKAWRRLRRPWTPKTGQVWN